MPIPINQDMVNKIAGEDLWEQENISYSINLQEAGHQTDAAEDKFGSPPDFVSIDANDRAAIQEAVELWDDLIDNSITENDIDSAVISVNEVTNLPSYSGGITFGTLHDTISGPDNEGVYLRTDDITVGSYAFTSAIHEFGHALGLSHPGDYNAGVDQPTYQNDRMFDEDTQLFSIMSYFDPSDNPSYANVNWSARNIRTPMIYDILAVQQLYGADTTTRSGDTTYGFHTELSDFRSELDQSVYTFTQTANVASPTDPTSFHFEINPAVFTIWDTGGDHDRIDASGFTEDQRIDLNPGTYSDIGETTAPDDPEDPDSTVHLVTLVDSIGIAFGVTIEEAIGGSGNDTITGNDADNYLDGGAGNDTIAGGDGNDTLRGGDDLTPAGPNDDTLYGGFGDDLLFGGSGNDALHGSSGNDALVAGDGNDFLFGESGIDVLQAGEGNDWLDGGGTLDTPGGPGQFGDILTGDGGDDFFIYGRAYGPTQITDFSQGVSGNSDFLDVTQTSVHNFTDLLAIGSQQGDDAVFDFGGLNKLTLQNFQLSALTPDGIEFSETTESPPPDFLLVQNPLAGQTNRGISTEIAPLLDNGFAAVVTELDSNFVLRLLLQRFDEDGAPVSTIAPNSSPGIGGGQIVALDDGRIVVAWAAYDAASGQNDIRARLFDADLQPLGNDFIVNSTPLVTPSAQLLDVVKTADGGFAISWKSDDDPSQYISYVSRMRAYDSSGTPTASDVIIPTADPPSLHDIHELALSSGRILYYWTETYSYSVAPFGTIYPDALFARLSDDPVAIRLDHDDYDGSLQVIELADGRIQFSWLSGTHTYLNLDHFSGTETVIFDSDLQGFTKPGTVGDDTLRGGIYNDRLYGLEGNDTLIGGRGPDILDGGPGTDTVDYDASLEGVVIDLTDAAPESGGHANGDMLIGVENIRGSAYADTIIGDYHDNRLDGSYGDDVIEGGLGDDVLIGGRGNDNLDGGGGHDQVSGDRGNDIIVLRGDEGGTAHGGDGNDEIDLLGNGATAYGEGGTDTFIVLGDDNFADGGYADGSYDDAPDHFEVRGSNNIVSGGAGAGEDFFRLTYGSHASGNTLIGGDGNDTFVNLGDGDNNAFYGGEGEDHFTGGVGSDLIVTDESYPPSTHDIVYADAGNDQVFSKGDHDILDGGEGTDSLGLDLSWFGGDILVSFDSHSQKFTFPEGTTAAGFENVEINFGYGTNTVQAASFAGSLVLRGDSGGVIDIFETGSGNDRLYGGGFKDILKGGDGDDYFNETGVGTSLIEGGAGHNSLSYEYVYGGIYADLANERVYSKGSGGGFDSDADLADATTFDTVRDIEKIYGGYYNDQFRGSAVDETFLPGHGNDGVVGGGGRDTVDYSNADYAVVASLVTGIVTEFAADAEIGRRFDTVLSTDHVAAISNLTGSGNDDDLTGDQADNVITGGLHGDLLTGNGGADIFVYRDNDGTDTITDFAPGVDRIDLTGAAGRYALSDLNIFQDGANTVISFEPIQGTGLVAFAATEFIGDGIVLENMEMGDLTERDFIFASPPEENHPPVVAPVNAVVTDEDTVSVPVAIGASDPDGDTLSYTLKSGFEPALGMVAFANGNFTYTPNADANGSDSFTIVIDDGAGGTAEQVVSVTINPVNDAEIELSSSGVNEFAANGTVVGQLATTGGGSNFSYEILADAPGGSAGHFFRIGGANHDQIIVTDRFGLDFEQAATLTLVVRSTDGAGQTVTGNLVVTLNDVDPETLTGDARDNEIHGGDGADVLNGGLGNDALEGGAGADRLLGGAGADMLSGGGDADTLDGGLDDDTLEGGDGDDRLIGGAGADLLTGGAGADTLIGGDGADTLTGGEDGDIYEIDGLDTVVETGLAGVDTVRSSVVSIDFTTGGFANIENIQLLGTAALAATGDDLANVITGNSGDNVLSGGGGADRLTGGAGNDTLNGGDGADQLNGGLGDDVLNGGAGADRLAGGEGADTLSGGEDGDTYDIDAFDTIVETGLAGVDTARSSVTGIDFTIGGFANIENIQLLGSAALDATGDGLANNITGNSGDNVLSGGGGGDRLIGGAGNDTLVGGTGLDYLLGGAGADTFVFRSVADSLVGTPDRIIDFTAGDHIDLTAIDADGDASNGVTAFIVDALGVTTFEQGHIRQTVSGGNLQIDLNLDGDAGAEMSIMLVALAGVPLTQGDLVVL